MERATAGINRDLVIVSALVLAICLSDSTITKDEERYRSTVEKLSEQLCMLIAMGDLPSDPKEMN